MIKIIVARNVWVPIDDSRKVMNSVAIQIDIVLIHATVVSHSIWINRVNQKEQRDVVVVAAGHVATVQDIYDILYGV